MSNEVPRFLLYSSGFLCFVVQLLGNNFWLKTGDDSGVFPISVHRNIAVLLCAVGNGNIAALLCAVVNVIFSSVFSVSCFWLEYIFVLYFSMDNRLAMLPKRPENNRPRLCLMAVRYVE